METANSNSTLVTELKIVTRACQLCMYILLLIDFWKIDFNIQMKPVARKENAYLEVENVNLVSTIKHLHIMLTNLFNGNKELGT